MYMMFVSVFQPPLDPRINTLRLQVALESEQRVGQQSRPTYMPTWSSVCPLEIGKRANRKLTASFRTMMHRHRRDSKLGRTMCSRILVDDRRDLFGVAAKTPTFQPNGTCTILS